MCCASRARTPESTSDAPRTDRQRRTSNGAKVDDLDAAIVAALRAEPMSANQLTKSIRRLRDDVYVATARLVDIGRLGRRGFVLHVAAEVS